jgi:hypothetical protein
MAIMAKARKQSSGGVMIGVCRLELVEWLDPLMGDEYAREFVLWPRNEGFMLLLSSSKPSVGHNGYQYEESAKVMFERTSICASQFLPQLSTAKLG